MTHVTRRLTAKNRDQLRNRTLGNRVWATFTFTFTFYIHTNLRRRRGAVDFERQHSQLVLDPLMLDIKYIGEAV